MKNKKALSGNTEFAKQIGLAVAPKVAVWGVGIIAVYFLVAKPILVSIGVIKTKEQKDDKVASKENATSSKSAFNPGYYKTVPGATLITRAKAEEYSKIIWDALGPWWTSGDDKEETVYGVFRQLKAKTQVSWLSEVFFKTYNRDLYGYLDQYLDDVELATVNNM